MSGKENTQKAWIDEVDFKEISSLHQLGFSAPCRVKELVNGRMTEIPKKKGVYIILAPCKGKMPKISDALKTAFDENGEQPKEEKILQEQWHEDTQVIYIGKAGVLNGKGTSNLYRRLRAYLKWYQKKKNSHHGGRDIWQLDNPGDLLVTWRVIEDVDPEKCEKALLDKFSGEFKSYPFANHRR